VFSLYSVVVLFQVHVSRKGQPRFLTEGRMSDQIGVSLCLLCLVVQVY